MQAQPKKAWRYKKGNGYKKPDKIVFDHGMIPLGYENIDCE